MNDMERPTIFCPDIGGEFISRNYVDYYDSAAIRRECTAPGKPQRNAGFESAICRALRAAMWLVAGFDDCCRASLPKIPFVGANGNRVWPEAVLWASDCLNRSATKPNAGWRHRTTFYSGNCWICRWCIFFHPGKIREDRSTKFDARLVDCFTSTTATTTPRSR